MWPRRTQRSEHIMEIAFKSVLLALLVGSCLAVLMAAAQSSHHDSIMMSSEETDMGSHARIPEEVKELGLTLLSDALKRTKLEQTLVAADSLTLFAPNNEAFLGLPDWARKAVQNTSTLTEILQFHAALGRIKFSTLINELLAYSLLGKQIRFNIYGKANANDPVYTAQCSPFELGRVDQPATNGVIHVLERVMIPPFGDAVAYLTAFPRFKILVKALSIAGLTETLKGYGPFTVFAPTDDAFGKLPPGALDKLLKNKTALANVLEYHVVKGTFCSAGLSNGPVRTMQGRDVSISISFEGIKVNDAKVVYPDSSITNGVLHIIDTVLMPPSFSLDSR
ncbi:fasciclin domain-containing protein [Plakobranchus ocellatus]|uniref:Fasciclin domain-containing protein n=1 Tax=Plakobranchus ocellatus TaxID=259542 RepID=A0AAV4AIW0_9GAST|nr:fasciclin domain-containing protein [Plakobranchus ocellatus]